jgi:hypothetical protein
MSMLMISVHGFRSVNLIQYSLQSGLPSPYVVVIKAVRYSVCTCPLDLEASARDAAMSGREPQCKAADAIGWALH